MLMNESGCIVYTPIFIFILCILFISFTLQIFNLKLLLLLPTGIKNFVIPLKQREIQRIIFKRLSARHAPFIYFINNIQSQRKTILCVAYVIRFQFMYKHHILYHFVRSNSSCGAFSSVCIRAEFVFEKIAKHFVIIVDYRMTEFDLLL